ncbi:MAG: vitamin K epoxide reductase family protein [Candidatus Micrarchaeaceae archaeon]
MKRNTVLAIVLILGIIDAGYLTIVHFMPSALDCPTINGLVNCETVLSSSFAEVFGVPLAILGLIWFVASLLFVAFGSNRIARNIWMIIGAGGVMYSFVAQSVVGRICVFCLALDILIIASVLLFLRSGKKK